ncbi:depolymerase [Benzoatithermus flavus]|uniref:PHB depolymerase family esterase n=1 Tax=Benzoatithermus flavus TaxID=3108223 RepID=A0ABU8XRQ1_9PROT
MIDRAAIRSALAVILAFALAVGADPVVRAAEPLRAYVADASGTSVSGMSSGGFMAVQFQVAFSNDVIGAGIVAGGPYYCSEGKIELALARCTGTWAGPPDPARLVAFAREAAVKDEIDPLENLARQRVLVFGGMFDTIVTPPVVAALAAFYREAGVPPERLAIRADLPAGHGFATQDFGSTCAATIPPFVNACGFDLAGAILQHIYGSLQPPAQAPAGRLVEFDQSEFLPDARAHGLDDTGLVYVPGPCEQDARRCRLHIVFHGCLQGRERVGDLFATRTGYNHWADSNGLIVLYPQAVATPRNPDGCWDWFGYDDPAFHVRSGRQMAAVKAMLDRIVAPGR